MATNQIKKSNTIIEAEESELNKLFKEVLDGIRDDLNEAQQNVESYYDSIVSATGGKEMWGESYHKALMIKGDARARQLKFIEMFKDRVTKKEFILAGKKKEAEGTFDHAELNKAIEELNEGKKFENIKPIIDLKASVENNDEEEDLDFSDEE